MRKAGDGKLGEIRLAQEDGPGLFEPGDDRGILLRDKVGQDARPPR